MALGKFGLLVGLGLVVAAGPVEAGQTQVAVAANFTGPAKEIAALFKAKTGDEALLSFGASGNFYTQISQGAPFQVFLSADADRPKAAVDGGFAVADSRFTYAIGKLVLWSKSLDRHARRGDAQGQFLHQIVDRQSQVRSLWRGGGRGDEGARRL